MIGTISTAMPDSRAMRVSVLVGLLSALCALAWIAALLVTSTGSPMPWLTVFAAVVVGGLSVGANGLIGREMARRKELHRDLQSAVRVQRSLFPNRVPDIAGCEFAMACRMSRAIGGDCVDAIRVGENRLALMVGDVSGKGIAAALVMSGVQSQFRTLVKEGLPLAAIARRIDEGLLDLANGQYITVVMLLLDVSTGIIEYLSAGHVPFILVSATGPSHAVDSTGPPLGLLGGASHGIEHLEFSTGSALILVTDGVTERRQGTIEYGTARLLAEAPRLASLSARQAVDHLLADNDSFAGGTAADDDLTIVVIKLTHASAGG